MTEPRRWTIAVQPEPLYNPGDRTPGYRPLVVNGPKMPRGESVEVMPVSEHEIELAVLREGNVSVCEDTGSVARDGVCPVHEGDACLVVPGAYVGEVRRLRAEQARTEAELTRLHAIEQAARTLVDTAQWYIFNLRDVIRHVPVRGMDEARSGYERADGAVRAALAAQDETGARCS